MTRNRLASVIQLLSLLYTTTIMVFSTSMLVCYVLKLNHALNILIYIATYDLELLNVSLLFLGYMFVLTIEALIKSFINLWKSF